MSPASPILEGLNPEQRAAVEHVDGPLLVLAGAGSGKTRMLTHRIAHLIDSGEARPHEILAVTFTNKAAREMRERVEGLLGGVSQSIWVSTFHSTCVRILRRDIGHLGYERHFGIYDQSDSLAAVKRVLKVLELSERVFPPRSVRAEIDRLKNRGLFPADLVGRDALGEDRIAEIYQRYATELRRANALDFGDLILLTVRLFQNHPEVLRYYQRRWRFILVDEYQDTNPIQYQLLRMLVDAHQNLCVVGDEDQSIYRFREADIRNILDFEKDFPGTAVVRLERNYRSTQAILDAATSVVQNNVERKGKKLYTDRKGGDRVRFYEASDDRGEAAFVVGELLKLREQGTSPSDVAIFYRTHAQSRPIEEELLKYNFPYAVIGGTRFYDRAEVKDALAYLRVLRNPHETESLLRVINRPARGIGRTTIERILALAEERQCSVYEALVAARSERSLSAAALKRVGAFLDLLDELRSPTLFAGAERGIGEFLARILDHTGYLRALEKDGSIEAESRLENLTELLAAADEFERLNRDVEPDEADAGEERSLVDLFLEQVTLISEADTLTDDDERVPLMTVHIAKGLEFPIVMLVGMEEGLFPHFASLSDPTALEEERRICYVGMTRARERLYLTNATMRRLHGSVRYNAPSRFLAEIPPEYVEGGHSVPAPSARSGRHVDYSEGQWEPDEVPPLKPGLRVEHPTFGQGTLVEQIGAGTGAKIRVRFDRAGLKTIVLRFAQLRILS